MLNMLQSQERRGLDFLSCSDSSPSLPQTIKLAVYLPASWFANMGFPSESVSFHRVQQFCRVDIVLRPIQGRDSFLAIQDREGPRTLDGHGWAEQLTSG